MDNQNFEQNVGTQGYNPQGNEKPMDPNMYIDNGKNMQFYEKLRSKVKNFSQEKAGKAGALTEYLFLLPDFFILATRLAVDKRVPAKKKLIAGAIISYLIMPLDIIPDFIPFIGHVDDLVLAVLGLNMILNDIDKEVLLDNWSGDEKILDLLQKISGKAEHFLDKNVMQRIKGVINKHADAGNSDTEQAQT